MDFLNKKIYAYLLISILLINNLFNTKVNANEFAEGYLNVATIGDVPIVEEILSSNDNNRPKTYMSPQYITVHNTDNRRSGADASSHSIYLRHNTAGRKVSWHYSVDDSKIVQHLPLNEVGWHAGDGAADGNSTSIGIEICENSDGNYVLAEKNAIKLIAELLYEYNLDVSKVVPHKHWSGKNCPNNLLNNEYGSMGWDNFISEIKLELDDLILKKSSIQKINPLTLKVGDEALLNLHIDNYIDTYYLDKDNYRLHLSSNEHEVIFKTVFNKEDIQYKQAAAVKNSNYEIIDANNELRSLLNDAKYYKYDSSKQVIIFEDVNDIFDESKLRFTQPGYTYLSFFTEKGSVEFVVYNYIAGNPIITTNIESLIEYGDVMSVLMTNNLDAEWESENTSIVEINNGKIIGKNPGETKINCVVNGVKISRDVIVEEIIEE